MQPSSGSASPDAGPLSGMPDEEVIERARSALLKVNSYPVGSIQRSVQWAVYEQAKAELEARLLRHVLRARRREGGR